MTQRYAPGHAMIPVPPGGLKPLPPEPPKEGGLQQAAGILHIMNLEMPLANTEYE